MTANIWQDNDETDGPCFYWVNPWTKKVEKIATLFWPEHPPEETARVERMFASMVLMIGATE